MSLLIKTIILGDQGPTLMTSLNLNYFLIPNIVILVVGASTYEFRAGHNSAHSTYFVLVTWQLNCKQIKGFPESKWGSENR